MGRQHDFRMNNAAFSCIVVGQSVPLVCQLLSGAVGCCGYGRFALSPADNLNAAMVDCDSITSRYGQQNPMKVNSLQSKVFAFVGYTKGRQRKLSQGKCRFPCRGASRQSLHKAIMPGAEIKPSAERTRPLGCISAPLCARVILRCRFSGSFSQNSCALSLKTAV